MTTEKSAEENVSHMVARMESRLADVEHRLSFIKATLLLNARRNLETSPTCRELYRAFFPDEKVEF